jgi:UDP-N-acetylmuramoyl-tripeptide--D-alanyl-D-alanine ligase
MSTLGKTTGFKPQITPDFVARALGLTLPPALLASSIECFTSVTTDSRKVQPGCLFVALKGENFDGHTFVNKAIHQGARGIVCQRGSAVGEPQSALVYTVDDTLNAFRKMAAAWRREFSIPFIAVAGAVGKTTTKELLTAILSGKFTHVLKTQGSQNGFVGIPMTLFDLRPEHEAAVIEVGIDEIGAMKQHMELVAATAAVLTTIGPEHLEKLRDVPTVAQEEGIALTFVAHSGGLVAINLDDPWIKPHAKTIRSGTKLTYGMDDAEAQIKGTYDSQAGTLRVQNTLKNEKTNETTTYPLPIAGLHNARNALAAIAIATGLGLTSSEITAGLKKFKNPDGRSEVREVGKSNRKIRVVCDYYNANPTSTEAGLDLLDLVAKKSKRFACLADMLELGTDEEKFHRNLSGPILKHSVEHVFLYGTRMKALQDELKKKNFNKDFRHFSDHDEMFKALTEKVQSGDTVLIKGSHSMKMEKVWESLKKWAEE